MDTQAVYDRLPGGLQTLLLNAYALRIHRERYGRRFERSLRLLLESERWSAAELQAFQEEHLRSLVRHCYESVPYYREVMDERRLRPEDVRSLADLPKLPLLTRETVARRGRDLLSRAISQRRRIPGHTSGTTGSPLSFYWDRDTCIMTNAVDWRQKLWAGLDRSTWYAVVLGRRVVSLTRSTPPFWRPNYLHKQLWMSTFHLAEANLDAFFEEMARRGVRAVEGYPSTCYILALYLQRAGRTFPLRCVLTSSETLHPVQRATIESAFACRVYDFFGLAERVTFATECEQHSGHHLNSEYGISEIVDANGDLAGREGRGFLVGTSLWNRAMPFLRYRTNDVTRIRTAPCACGRTLPLMDDVATKAEDLVRTPDGRLVSPSTLTHPFKPLHSIRKSQIVQTALDRILVKLVPHASIDRDEVAALVEGLRARLGNGVRIDVEQVNEIEPLPSGKFRWVISEVARETPDLSLWDEDEVAPGT